MHDHTSSHLFECKSLPTSLSSLDLWTNPDKVEPFLATWGRDCWLPHDSGAGLCWQHVGGVGSTTTTTTPTQCIVNSNNNIIFTYASISNQSIRLRLEPVPHYSVAISDQDDIDNDYDNTCVGTSYARHTSA